MSRCVSEECKALALWLTDWHDETRAYETRLVYPHASVRIPPADGLEDEEVKLYEEAAKVSPASRRAASALLRVLLEAFLKRHLTAAGQSVENKRLVGLIELAEDHLDLSPTLKTGLTAIRKRGNAAVHDPYGLTDDTRAGDLPWLFLAVDELVEELHVKRRKWADMAETDPNEHV